MLTGYESGPGLPHFGRRLDVTVKIRRGDSPAGSELARFGNQDAFLEERTMESDTKTLSCRKGPWNGKPWQRVDPDFPGSGRNASIQSRADGTLSGSIAGRPRT